MKILRSLFGCKQPQPTPTVKVKKKGTEIPLTQEQEDLLIFASNRGTNLTSKYLKDHYPNLGFSISRYAGSVNFELYFDGLQMFCGNYGWNAKLNKVEFSEFRRSTYNRHTDDASLFFIAIESYRADEQRKLDREEAKRLDKINLYTEQLNKAKNGNKA